jgi:hypothetical protein
MSSSASGAVNATLHFGQVTDLPAGIGDCEVSFAEQCGQATEYGIGIQRLV